MAPLHNRHRKALAVGYGPKQYLVNEMLYATVLIAFLADIALRCWPLLKVPREGWTVRILDNLEPQTHKNGKPAWINPAAEFRIGNGAPGFVATTDTVPVLARSLAGIATVTWAESKMVVGR